MTPPTSPSLQDSGPHSLERLGIIRVEDARDLMDWALYFSVSKARVREAVAAVGPWAEDVKRFLGR